MSAEDAVVCLVSSRYALPFPSRLFQNGKLIDAVRVSDDKLVGLKKLSKSVHPFEAEIGNFFSSEPLSSAPDNHCVPIHDVLQVPGRRFYYHHHALLREYNSPHFETMGEVVDFFS